MVKLCYQTHTLIKPLGYMRYCAIFFQKYSDNATDTCLKIDFFGCTFFLLHVFVFVDGSMDVLGFLLKSKRLQMRFTHYLFYFQFSFTKTKLSFPAPISTKRILCMFLIFYRVKLTGSYISHLYFKGVRAQNNGEIQSAPLQSNRRVVKNE